MALSRDEILQTRTRSRHQSSASSGTESEPQFLAPQKAASLPLDDRFAEHLSSLCRSLEDLELDHCTCEIRSIASDSLKSLVLKHCTWGRSFSGIASPTLKTLVIDGGSNDYRTLLAISAPMVVDLRLDIYVGGFHGGISMNEMPSLDRASIRLRSHKYSLLKGLCSRELGQDQSKLLCGVSNATSLELFSVGKTLLGKKPAFQEFQNLRNLLLGNCDLSDEFRTLIFDVRLIYRSYLVILRTRMDRANWRRPHLVVAAVALTFYLMRTWSLKS